MFTRLIDLSSDENNENFGYENSSIFQTCCGGGPMSIDLLVESGSNMKKMDSSRLISSNKESDTYVYITLVGDEKYKKMRTGKIDNNKDPQWNR